MDTQTASANLAADITHQASKQTYYTIQALVPQERKADALRAYGYFRWLDDLLDGDLIDRDGRIEVLGSQKRLLSHCLENKPPRSLRLEECMLVDLTQGPMGMDAGLRMYLQAMMEVMEFDTHRRGRRLTLGQLDWYSRKLATAVTEAVYTFIGAGCKCSLTAERYEAADAAHIVHMLRDLLDDLDAGYINIPLEVLPAEHIREEDLDHPQFRTWVRSRIETARSYFAQGRGYLMAVDNYRCRMAGALYEARFLGVMKAIEREDFRLRRDYSDCMGLSACLRVARESLRACLAKPMPGREPDPSKGMRPA